MVVYLVNSSWRWKVLPGVEQLGALTGNYTEEEIWDPCPQGAYDSLEDGVSTPLWTGAVPLSVYTASLSQTEKWL